MVFSGFVGGGGLPSAWSDAARQLCSNLVLISLSKQVMFVEMAIKGREKARDGAHDEIWSGGVQIV